MLNRSTFARHATRMPEGGIRQGRVPQERRQAFVCALAVGKRHQLFRAALNVLATLRQEHNIQCWQRQKYQEKYEGFSCSNHVYLYPYTIFSLRSAYHRNSQFEIL